MILRSLKNYFYGTLRNRLILNVAVIHAIMMTIFIGDLTIRQRTLILQRQQENVIAISHSLSSNAVEWIASNDIEGLQELVEAESHYPEIAFVIITNQAGRILAHSDKSYIGQQLLDIPNKSQQTIIKKTQDLIDDLTPVMSGGKLIGWVRIGLGQKLVNQKLDAILFDGILYTLTAIIIGSLLAWIIGTRITKRLYDIQKTINEVIAGNTNDRSAISGNDEISVLAKSFNEMIDVRIKSRKELQEKNKLLEDYKFALDQSTIISITDENGIIKSVNDSFCKVTKYSREELIGKSHSVVNSKYHSADFFKNMWDTIIAGNIWRGEVRNKTKEGKYYWVFTTIIPFLNENKKPFQYLSIRYDITENKKAEEEIEESREKYMGLSDATFESIFFSEKGVCIEQNQTAERIFGYSTEEAIGRYGTEWIVPEDREMVMNNMLRGFEEPYEATALKKDGTTFPCLLQGKMMYYKGRNVRVTSLTDITKQKETEEELRKSHAVIEGIFNTISVKVFWKDKNLKYAGCNAAFAKQAGFSDPTEIIGKDDFEMQWSEHAELYRRDDLQVIESGYSKLNIEQHLKMPDGNSITLLTCKIPLRNSNGQIDGVLGTEMDITEHKKIEQELIENSQMLNTVFENSPIGKAVLDKNSVLIKGNKKLFELFGMDAGSLLNRYDLKSDPHYHNQEVWNQLNQGNRVHHEIQIDFDETRYKSIRTGIGYLEIITTPISETVSKNIGYIVQVTDITDKKLHEQKISKAIIKTQEDERYEVGGELHDNVCQVLVAAQMNLSMLNKMVTTSEEKWYIETKNLINTAIEDIRDLSHRLAPTFFSTTKLDESFKSLINTFRFEENIKIHRRIEVDVEKYDLSPQLQLNLYRILQEQLSNIQKHSKAEMIDIDLRIVDKNLKLIIVDNGIGFDIQVHKDGIGISNMKRRAEMFSGRFDIISTPGNGCLVMINIPVVENKNTDEEII